MYILYFNTWDIIRLFLNKNVKYVSTNIYLYLNFIRNIQSIQLSAISICEIGVSRH